LFLNSKNRSTHEYYNVGESKSCYPCQNLGKNEYTGFRKSQKLLTGRSQQSFKGGHIDSLKEAAFLVVGNERVLAMSTILPVPVDEGKRGSALFPMKNPW